MGNKQVVIVAFKEFDNLGAGYLASVLIKEGYEAVITDLREGKEEILKTINKFNPQIVGFSVIFQYYIYEFAELVSYLRKEGIKSHFSAGGQYASMRPEELFRFIPELDSIVRFEGEYTFLELVSCICSGSDWKQVEGLAYKGNGEIIATRIRPPESDIDKFPFPLRSPLELYCLEKKFATIIAGRGCIHNCSFCNNTEYIRQSSATHKRHRTPENVVEEMELLYYKENCSVFLFEDDDFPVKIKNGYDWTDRFCKAIRDKKLAGKIVWKMNCRSDEIEYDSFALMKEHGLFLVFIGIDDGTDAGLARLNKHMTVDESLRGINILKQLDIGIDYGFMLFQPDSTFMSVNSNLDFLGKLCHDGNNPVTFLKLEPYFDTAVEKVLRTEGRIKGKPGFLDYDFLSVSLDRYFEYIMDSFMEWLNNPEGLVNISKWARNYFAVFSHLYKINKETEDLKDQVRSIVAQSNLFIVDMMKELSDIFSSGRFDNADFRDLSSYRVNIEEKEDLFKDHILKAVTTLSNIAKYQKIARYIYI